MCKVIQVEVQERGKEQSAGVEGSRIRAASSVFTQIELSSGCEGLEARPQVYRQEESHQPSNHQICGCLGQRFEQAAVP